MNAGYIADLVISEFERRYGRGVRVGRSRLLQFGTALTCSINYSKLLRGQKYFFGLSQEMVDQDAAFPETQLGAFVALVCGSETSVLIIPRDIVLSAMAGVTTRRLDVFCEDGLFVLQTTGHPKLNVTEFLNAYPRLPRPSAAPGGEVSETPASDRAHVRIQWGLIKLGRAEGCSVWVPPSDRILSYQAERFDAHTLARLPRFGFDENTRRIVENVDVLWLDRNVIRRAFEIESTTAIYSGLLRLNDLVLAQPNNRIDLYIVAPSSRQDRVHAQLTRLTFQPLIERCQFLSFEMVDEQTRRLDTLLLDADTRIAGLLRGTRFSLPDHYLDPDPT